MQITTETVEAIAHLARLEFDPASRLAMENDMNRMLAFVEKLNELNTKDIDPLVYMTADINVLREDKVIQNTSQQEALKNAPKRDSDYFKVPKVIPKK